MCISCRIVRLVLLLIALPYGLVLIYPFLYPPSTLMLADWLTQKKVEQEWVPLRNISPRLIMAVVASEDDAFCTHMGVDFQQMEKSIEKAQASNRPVKATSTISQQLVKNLFFWQGRSWVRKMLEVPLTFWLELVWRKTWIIEAYLNVAEWDEGIYGIEAAAQHYYGTSASKLSFQQSVLLATSLPNPRERNAARPGPAQREMAAQLLSRLQHSGPDLGCIR